MELVAITIIEELDIMSNIEVVEDEIITDDVSLKKNET